MRYISVCRINVQKCMFGGVICVLGGPVWGLERRCLFGLQVCVGLTVRLKVDGCGVRGAFLLGLCK